MPYGEGITAEKLRRIDDAEEVLRGLGFGQYRVRSHGDLARIEVPETELERLFSLRREVRASLTDLGFVYVTMDLQGFQSGSMNRTIETT